MKRLATYILIGFSLSACGAQSPQWFDLLESARRACIQGHLETVNQQLSEAKAGLQAECPDHYVNPNEIELKPSSYPGELATLAYCLAHRGAYSQAEKLAQNAVDLARKYPNKANLAPCLRALAQIDLLQSKNDAAIKLMEEAVALKSAGIEDYVTLGDTYAACGNNLKAESAYQIAIDKDTKLNVKSPSLPAYLNKLGHCYLLEKNYKQAEKLYLQALAYTPVSDSDRGDTFNVKDLQPLAEFYTVTNQNDKADIYYRDALSGSNIVSLSDRIQILKNYAKLLRKLNRTKEADERELQAKNRESELAREPEAPRPVIFD